MKYADGAGSTWSGDGGAVVVHLFLERDTKTSDMFETAEG